VGEIQKAYNAYTGILKREADNAYSVIEELRDGPIAMPKDQEWIHFVTHDEQFLDPTIPLRSPQQIHYPGQDHVSAQEIRAGLLERKSKYLKSYTAGWYVLSTTHLHEFKSADKGQAPVMSLYLPEQKLGSRSSGEGSSNKFILKGRQTGAMHRGHTWVFRAESHDTMMAWYEDIKALTEKTPEERSQFVRHHSRSLSQSSRRSASSDGGLVDEDDDEPFAAGSRIDVNPGPRSDAASRRSQPGGRFPSDIQVNAQRGLQAPRSASSLSSSSRNRMNSEYDGTTSATAAAAGALSGPAMTAADYEQQRDGRGYADMEQTPVDESTSNAAIAGLEAQHDGVNPYTSEPMENPHHQPFQQQEQQQQSAYYVAPIVAPQAHQYLRQEEPVAQQEQRDASGQNVVAAGYIPPSHAGNNGQFQQQQTTNGQDDSHVTFGGVAGVYNSAETDLQDQPPIDAGINTHIAATDGAATTTSDVPTRPTENTTRNDSVNTISNLHVPGGYPRPSVA
jgi:hypothetical protein